MNKYLIILSITMAIGCNNRTDKINNTVTDTTFSNTEPVNSEPAGNNIPSISGCYMLVFARDTFATYLQQQGNKITGRLSFDNYEKDGSSGIVSGKLQGDILKLYYSFASEGMNSVMEVFFKYEDGKLVRGTGNLRNRGDTAYFTNTDAINYDGSVLIKIPCETLPAKYR